MQRNWKRVAVTTSATFAICLMLTTPRRHSAWISARTDVLLRTIRPSRWRSRLVLIQPLSAGLALAQAIPPPAN